MELWVRTQDKRELVKTNAIYLVRVDKYFHIYCYVNNGEIDLGQYGDFEDKTRALEVLDEIQDKIEYFDSVHYNGNKTTIIYEMPKE